MTVPVQQHDQTFTDNAKAIVENLLSASVVTSVRIGGGLNSKVFCVSCEDGQDFVAKFYYQNHVDHRDRLGVEYASLQYLRDNGIRDIPQPIAMDKTVGCAIYEYIHGERIKSDEVTVSDINEAVRFLATLKDLSRGIEKNAFLRASEACFSVQAIFENIQARFVRLVGIKESGEEYARMHQFLQDEVAQFLQTLREWCQVELRQANISFEEEIVQHQRTLSPSDFGFHNALRRESGRIAFLDFEYFGWDDPAKMISDFIMHPGMLLRESQKRQFVIGALQAFHEDADLTRRVAVVCPLFGLKWCLIFLNEFVPQDFQRRDFAHSPVLNRNEILNSQLNKAKQMLNYIQQTYQHFSYHE